MIIEYYDSGEIWHVFSDPADPEALAIFLAKPNTKHLPPIPMPALPLRNPEGEIQLDPEGHAIMSAPGYIEPECSVFTHMIVNDEVVERPLIPPLTKTEIRADGKDFIPIFGLPDPVKVYVDGEPYEITGGRLDFTADQPGTYRLSIGWPCQTWSGEIVAK